MPSTPIHPGEHLAEELNALGLSAAALLNNFFEHPVLLERQFHMNAFSRCVVYKPSFSPDC